MKKFFVFLAAGLFLTACSDDVAAPQVGQEQEVALSFQLPETIAKRAMGGTNSALGGASNCAGDITFTAALYYNGKEIWRDNATASLPNANASVTFRPTLVLGENYQLVAYAQMDGVITDLTKQDEANAINDETVDAYYVSTSIKAEATMSATLKRATGKLRIIAEDFAAAEAQLSKTIENVAITYKQAQPTEFNPTTGNWAAEATEVEFTEVVTEYTSEGDAKTLLVDYIPATATGEIINIEKVVVTFSDGTTFEKNLSTLDIPVKRNYLTTLRGNFFMEDMDLNIKIDDAFDGEEEVAMVSTVAALNEALAAGQPVVLANDITIAAGESVTVAAGETAEIDLGGNTLSVEACNLVNNGTMTISNGKVTAPNTEAGRRCIYNYGEMTIDGVEFTQLYGYKGAAINNEGKMVIEDATVNSVFYAVWNSGANAELTINDGKYTCMNDESIKNTWAYCVNSMNGAKITINGGEFVGNHGVIGTASGAEATLNAGKFHCTATFTGISDWAIYAGAGSTITYDAANCEITSANPNGAIYDKSGTIVAK